MRITEKKGINLFQKYRKKRKHNIFNAFIERMICFLARSRLMFIIIINLTH